MNANATVPRPSSPNSPAAPFAHFACYGRLRRGTRRVVSKAELLEHCWGPHFDGCPAVVEVHVHRLRRKIDPAVGAPVIQTLREEGYMIPDDAA
jgi:DNA-binding response OmpR family regulator